MTTEKIFAGYNTQEPDSQDRLYAAIVEAARQHTISAMGAKALAEHVHIPLNSEPYTGSERVRVLKNTGDQLVKAMNTIGFRGFPTGVLVAATGSLTMGKQPEPVEELAMHAKIKKLVEQMNVPGDVAVNLSLAYDLGQFHKANWPQPLLSNCREVEKPKRTIFQKRYAIMFLGRHGADMPEEDRKLIELVEKEGGVAKAAKASGQTYYAFVREVHRIQDTFEGQ